jgi:hemoglobin/transferrin/lactoferrin receptor protein
VTQSYPYQEIVSYRPNPRGGPPIPVYGPTITAPGSYNTVNGRKASNALDMHAIKIGLNYRF